MLEKNLIIRGSGGDEPDEPYVPIEAPNSLQSKATWRVIDLISEGEIRGLVAGAKSIFLDDVQLQADSGEYNFEGVTWEQRVGTPSQAVVKGVRAVELSVGVGVEVSHDTGPVTRTITDSNLDAVRVHLSIPALFEQKDNGDLLGSVVSFTIEIVGSSGVTKTVRGKCMSTYEFNYRVELPEGEAPWDIRITKNTEDSADSKKANTLNWVTYTTILDHRLRYPDTALIAGVIDSQLFGGRVPRRSYEIYGQIIRVPSNYNPTTRVYTGIWNGTFHSHWSDNPAWCFYDMITHDRYGLGLPGVDKWALYTIGQYCDELIPDCFGGLEPRFTMNCHFNTKHEAYSLLNTMASVFRGMPIWSTGDITCFQDSPAAAQILVSPANVKDGVFSYEGSDLKARYTVAYVTWNDPANQYKPVIEPVANRAAVHRYGYREIEVAGLCTSQGQAHRLGRWLTDTPESEKETVTYIAGQDHAFAMPGMIIDVADPWRANIRMGGRLKDGFASGVIGTNETNDAPLWSLVAVTIAPSETESPNNDVGYTITDASPAVAGFCVSASTSYVFGEVFLSDIFIEKDTVANRVCRLLHSFSGGASSSVGYTFRTDTGAYATSTLGGATIESCQVFEYDHWWRVRTVFSAGDSGNTSLSLTFSPAYGPDLSTYSGATIGSTTIAGARLCQISGADYNLLNPLIRLRLDSPVVLAEGETYQVSVVLPDNTIEQVAITNIAGTHEVLSVTPALSLPPVPNAMFVITGTDIAPRKFRLLSKTDNNDGTFNIIAVEHDPTKYARVELDIDLEPPIYYLPTASGPVLPPNNAELLLKTYYTDGKLRNMLVFTWEASTDERVVHYQVEWKIEDDNWTTLPIVKGYLVDKYDIKEGHYYFRVRAVTATGATSVAIQADMVVGENAMPDVTGLALVDGSSSTEFVGGSAKFTWDTVSIADIPTAGGVDLWFKSYIVEIWKSSSLVRTEYPTINQYEYTFEKNTADSGPDRTFTIKVYQLGNLGQISNTAAELEVSNPAPTMAGFSPVVTDVFKGLQINWSSWSSSDADISMIKVYLGTSNPPTTLVNISSSTALGVTISDLVVGTNYNVRLLPCDAFGDGVYSSVAGGTPLILEGVDVDIELTESIVMTDSDSNSAATLAKLYDRNTTADGVTYVLSGAVKLIDYSYGVVSYIDKVIIHTADANGQVYFATSPEGSAWSWFKAEADHTLTSDGKALAAADQADAATNYLQLAAGLNVITLPQRVIAANCRLYMTGTYTTEIYELVFIREVIAEQIVADNLSAISANLGTVVTGYMQSENYDTDAGVKFDLTNSELHIGGSDGGTLEDGLSFVPGEGVNIVGSIVSNDPVTGDYGHLSAGDLTFYFKEGTNYYPYQSVRQIIPGTATNGVLFTIPGYWRSAPQVFPSMQSIQTFNYASRLVDQQLDLSVDTPEELTTGVWQTTIYARLLTGSGKVTKTWGNETAYVIPTTSTWAWYYDTEETAVYTSPVNVVNITASCSMNWQYHFPLINQQVSIEVYFYINSTKYIMYSTTKSWSGQHDTTIIKNLSKSIARPAGSYEVKVGVKVGIYGSNGFPPYSSCTLSSIKAACNIGAGAILATGDVFYIAFGED